MHGVTGEQYSEGLVFAGGFSELPIRLADGTVGSPPPNGSGASSPTRLLVLAEIARGDTQSQAQWFGKDWVECARRRNKSLHKIRVFDG